MNVNAACSGGIITAGALGHLAAIGEQDKVGALTMMVCALDQARMGTAGAFASRELAAAAVAESARKGYIDGRALAGVFAWLRPNDLVWNYVVNNYLLGKDPPAFDILYWNQDSVRLAAGLHRDFVRTALDNALTRPGEVEVLGTPDRSRRDHAGQLQHRRTARPHRARGRTRTAARSCSAAPSGSSSRPAATSRRWSTRRAPRAAPATASPTTPRMSPRHGSRRPTSSAAAGGLTTATGSRRARGS